MNSNSKKGKPSLLLATQENDCRIIEDNRKSIINKSCETKLYASNKASKTILKPSIARKILPNVSSTASEFKKCGQNPTQSQILMTTIDSDGIKSVTSAAGTKNMKFSSFFVIIDNNYIRNRYLKL